MLTEELKRIHDSLVGFRGPHATVMLYAKDVGPLIEKIARVCFEAGTRAAKDQAWQHFEDCGTVKDYSNMPRPEFPT